jgi:hypothetical protein
MRYQNCRAGIAAQSVIASRAAEIRDCEAPSAVAIHVFAQPPMVRFVPRDDAALALQPHRELATGEDPSVIASRAAEIRHCEAPSAVAIHVFAQPPMVRFVPRDDAALALQPHRELATGEDPSVIARRAAEIRHCEAPQRRGNPCLCTTAHGSLRASR